MLQQIKSEIPILWSDSIMFQKMQHFAHGDITTSSPLITLIKELEVEKSYYQFIQMMLKFLIIGLVGFKKRD